MNSDIEQQIQDLLPEMRKRQHVLMFSTGADSIASFLRLREWGIAPAALVYHYYVPDIPMVEAYLRYFEEKFNVRVYRILGTLGCQAIGNGLFQMPGTGMRMFRKNGGIARTTKAMLNNAIMSQFRHDAIMDVGLRYSDGMVRWKVLTEQGPMRGQEFNPTASFTRTETRDLVADHHIKLPFEYRLTGRSFESIRWSVSKTLRLNAPKTWAYLKEWFPMINLLCAQSELLPEDRDQNNRVHTYGSLAFETEDCK